MSASGQLLVLGMHRSGTSLLTHLLHLAGCSVGSDGVFPPPDRNNPKGFWERLDALHLNDAILAAAGGSWHDVPAIPEFLIEGDPAGFVAKARAIASRLDAEGPWVLKDPRLCVLLPIWRRAVPAPICIHVVRDPLEVALSLQAWHGFPLAFGIALWEQYNLAGLAGSRGLRRISVAHHRLLADPVGTFDILERELGRFGVRLRSPGDGAIAETVEPALHRQRAAAGSSRSYLNPLQADLWGVLEAGHGPDLEPVPDLSPAAVDTLRIFNEARRAATALEARHAHLMAELETLRRDATQTGAPKIEGMPQRTPPDADQVPPVGGGSSPYRSRILELREAYNRLRSSAALRAKP